MRVNYPEVNDHRKGRDVSVGFIEGSQARCNACPEPKAVCPSEAGIEQALLQQPFAHDNRALGAVEFVTYFLKSQRCVKALCRDGGRHMQNVQVPVESM